MRSKSFSRFLRERSDVRVTTSLMPAEYVSARSYDILLETMLTRIFRIFWADILVTRIQDIFVHQRRARCHLSEERDFHRLANLDPLPFLYEYLPCILASVFAIQTGHAVLFWVMTLFEGLESCHKVVTTSHTRGNDTLSDASCHSSFDDGSDRVHGADDFRLELGRDMKFYLLEQIFRGAKAADDKDILKYR